MSKRISNRVKREELVGGRRLSYWLRRSRRARHILLHVGATGEVEVVVPWRVSYRQGERFVREREEWLTERLLLARARRAKMPRRRLATGEELPFLGSSLKLRIEIEPDRQRSYVRRRGGVLTVKVNARRKIAPAIQRWYRENSHEYFWNQARAYALQLGVRVDTVQVLDTTTQWGSCNKAKRALTFQWKLALAPVAVAQYVVAHEVAHLKRADHSPAFWNIVKELDQDYAQHQRWLKEHGYTLVL